MQVAKIARNSFAGDSGPPDFQYRPLYAKMTMFCCVSLARGQNYRRRDNNHITSVHKDVMCGATVHPDMLLAKHTQQLFRQLVTPILIESCIIIDNIIAAAGQRIGKVFSVKVFMEEKRRSSPFPCVKAAPAAGDNTQPSSARPT